MGLIVGVAPAIGVAPPVMVQVSVREAAASQGVVISGCRVTDGDSVRCGKERIRLLGIDAPELPGHCRPGRDCAPGDPVASTDSLRDAITGTLRIERVGEDRYGRTLAMISSSEGDLSCAQLRGGQAIYRSDWDDGSRVARMCPEVAN